MSSAPHDSSITTTHRNKCVFDEKLSTMMEGNDGAMMVHRPVQKPISPSIRQALTLINDQQDTSDTVPQSNFAVAGPGAGEKHRREVQVSKLIYASSLQHASSPLLSDEDTQDFYHAGAPPSVLEFSLWTMLCHLLLETLWTCLMTTEAIRVTFRWTCGVDAIPNITPLISHISIVCVKLYSFISS